ncbi:hypothetical protein COU20_00955 [Candidatus Kaiserbacteria bacterium CG10_big_fil_rev_8_21_14_0_10_59_10]|uniref:Small-conductance mechanosensitive ion channel n=1 Tax=Candidatus Kaiserbacteria bacterium CG10_big_fil_rev_8_21_14_0_10_59_10 TaxID=1974612 RepID=A0A2H0U8J6_9BACT|nr:MAG: hypothetical protein COU20_00955 [Candidatus Kaiserbacteria bacterium CG10_big_fil_rev_8_21_14_0_10_59_10]
MIVAETAGALQASFNDVWLTVVHYVPAIIAAVVIFVIGWVVGMILARVIEQVVAVLRVDDALRSTGLNDAVKSAGFSLNVGRLLGELVKWFVIIVFLITALEVLGLVRVTVFLQQVVSFLPHVFVAVLILIIAAIVADVVKNVVTGSARAAGVTAANLAGAVAKWAIWIFAIMAALNQLGVGVALIQTLFMGLVIALSLAFGLAFGLGGKEAASKTIERIRSDVSHGRE